MTVPDAGLKTLPGFPQGVNNVAKRTALPRDDKGMVVALRGAKNMDLVGVDKQPRLRAGYSRVVSGRTHSPAQFLSAVGKVLLAAVNGDLKAYDTGLSVIGTVRAAIGQRYLSYAQVNDDLCWSNGEQIRRVRGEDLADGPLWPEAPGTPNATALTGYALDAGTYRLALTWLDAEGRESAASGLVEVDVAANGGIQVNQFPSNPEGAAKKRLYLSPPNGEELYAVGDYATGVSNTVIGQKATGRALETAFMRVLPPCQTLRYWNGRLLGASGNLLVWSEALRYGLMRSDNYLKFGAEITLLEPVGHGDEQNSGIYIADQRYTYWCAGGTPSNWRKVIRYDHPAVPGTSIIVKGRDVGLENNEPVAFWLAKNGVFMAGEAGGTVHALTEGRLAAPYGTVGASVFREYEGLRQIVTSFIHSGTNRLGITDHASAVVTTQP